MTPTERARPWSIYEAGRKKTYFKAQVPGTSTYRRTTSENLGCITVE